MTNPVTPGASPDALSGLLPGVPARLVPAATELIWALRTGAEREIATAFGQATAIAGGGVRGLRALALLLAAMVPDDEAPSHLLGWLDDPDGYLRLRGTGLSRVAAIDTVRVSTDPAHGR